MGPEQSRISGYSFSDTYPSPKLKFFKNRSRNPTWNFQLSLQFSFNSNYFLSRSCINRFGVLSRQWRRSWDAENAAASPGKNCLEKLIRFGILANLVRFWQNLGKIEAKIWPRFCQIWLDLDKIKILHPQKLSISYDYAIRIWEVGVSLSDWVFLVYSSAKGATRKGLRGLKPIP